MAWPNVIIEDGRLSGPSQYPTAERDYYVEEWAHGFSFRVTLHEFPIASWQFSTKFVWI